MSTFTSTTSPIFIGGLMKSGTTLLRSLLSNHPRIFGGLETHWFLEGFGEQGHPATSVALEFFDVDDKVAAELHVVAKETGKRNPSAAFLQALMANQTALKGKARWVEKTPGNVFIVDEIYRDFQDARFIHVVRDLRDVYASWKRNKKYDLSRFLDDVEKVKAANESRLGTSSDVYLEVHYRDLVVDTKKTMQRVVEFCGEEWVDGIEKNEKGEVELKKVFSVTGKHSPTLESLSRPVFQNSVGQYREVLSGEEIETIENSTEEYSSKTQCFL